ncbi:YicC/YloC family endoribonuclease [Rhizobium sp. SSA_523]|uniref:YicC/YloC family endoribonuclease n=1 Tax=Rhizobium sp. SSA_523 TaxID=2952477 RepID=UPI0020907792|nr:YicC/YloC family endoribonuclease [Rhizobium sp. SSA_523]MCO5730766.1 YicC family protein [Rhizobium sp. SSA_523]WKC24410.1 YicC/YloC family endoribonuclease [Rhizobium sp. SSA_523]
MNVQSMTGFARREGSVGRHRWVWELRSVNGKSLDLRLRLPGGFEALETDVRRLVGARLTRGNLQVTLSTAVTEAKMEAVVNREALSALKALRTELGDLVDPSPLRLDSLLTIRGLVDFREAAEGEAAVAERDAAVLDGLTLALDDLIAMRLSEGRALEDILSGHIATVARLVEEVEADPSRSTEEIARRLKQQVALLMENGASLDRERLYAEAALLATKADLREEIDRLKAHVAAARELLDKGGPIGRRLDFLAQEFNREANTICSKSNAAPVTARGLELKVVIDQFREQVQNLE